MLEKEWIEVLSWCLAALMPLCLRCRCLGLMSSSSGNVSTTFQLPAIASFVSSLVWIFDSILHGNASLPPWPPRPFLSFWSSGLHLRKIAITHQHLEPNNHPYIRLSLLLENTHSSLLLRAARIIFHRSLNLLHGRNLPSPRCQSSSQHASGRHQHPRARWA